MSYGVSPERMDSILKSLRSKYKIYAPKKSPKQGWNDKEYIVRYSEIDSISDVVFDEPADFSPKEVFYPVVQTMMHFRGESVVENQNPDEKGIIIFARPCDINGIERLDNIFLANGDNVDHYYKSRRDKVKFFLLDCNGGWDSCFCASMGSNKTDNYSAALKFEDDTILVMPKDDVLEGFFCQNESMDYSASFVEENKKKVRIPNIDDRSLVEYITGMDYWNQYDENCVSCGGCNTVCITCSCFDTVDVIYNETSMEGERRRVWSSCMLDSFSTMAGGHNVRSKPSQRHRFKTLHKVYDYQYRFQTDHQMCVGCGRCDNRCPEDIKFSETINGLSAAVDQLLTETVEMEGRENEE